jgi:hypothetical protein
MTNRPALDTNRRKSYVVDAPKGLKNVCPATLVAGSTALPFVISTGNPGEERSGEICGFSGPSLGSIFRQSVAQRRDPQSLRGNHSWPQKNQKSNSLRP